MAKNLLINKNSKKQSDREDLHKQHRRRVKENFRKCGLDGFQPHNVLEMLLFYSIPRQDTNELAHILINEFGSFSAVFDAPIEALMNVKGVGIETATLIKFIPELYRVYEANKFSRKVEILSSDDAKKYLASFYKAATYEKFVILYLDGRGRILKEDEITQCKENMVYTDLASIVKSAIMLNAKGIVISHNHVTGFAVPSTEDKVLTEKLAKMCEPVGVFLCDHIIFAGKDACCLSKSKFMKSKLFAF